MPLGISSGDITSNSAILWSKTNQNGNMNILVSESPNFTNNSYHVTQVDSKTKYISHFKVNNLSSDTIYFYKIWFSDPIDPSIVSDSLIGKFNTAPAEDVKKNISFIVGGDLGGQQYCKRLGLGYPIFTVIKNVDANFFIANGDMIYGDSTCTKEQPLSTKGWENIRASFPSVLDESVDWKNSSEVYDIYAQHWEYNKADDHYKKMLQSTPIYSQADDHEVADNYNGNSTFYKSSTENRSGFSNLVNEGLNAFFMYSPLERNKQEPTRIYRDFNWGQNLDIFLLDLHQYRTHSSLEDTPQNKKTLLGHAQLKWLKNSLNNSQATWKAVLTTVPLSVPHCGDFDNGCDSWATNNKTNKTFTSERNELLRYLDEINIKNLIFIVTDAHYPANIVINDDFDNDGDTLRIYEFISGPLNAGTYDPELLDPTINARYTYNETGFFNFGLYEISNLDDNNSTLLSSIITTDGLVRKGSQMKLSSE